jgi:hypothetical protein
MTAATQADSTDWAGNLFGLFGTAVEGYFAKESAREQVQGDNVSANPYVHNQPVTGVDNTGIPLSGGSDVMSWIKTNWLAIVLVVVVLVAVVAGVALLVG